MTIGDAYAAPDRRPPRIVRSRRLRPVVAARLRIGWRDPVAVGEGRSRPAAAAHVRARRVRRIGDRRTGSARRHRRRRRAAVRDGGRQRRDRRRRHAVPARRRADRDAREQRPHPARLLQGRGQDRRDVPGDRRRPLRRARRHGIGGRRRVRSRSTDADRCRSTRAARRSFPRKWRRRSRATPPCSTRPSSARRTSASARRSPRWSSSGPITPTTRPALAELQEHCRQHLAGYKVPRAVVFVDDTVRSPSGKPDYRWAKETALAGLADTAESA